jgi:hypothetical protein
MSSWTEPLAQTGITYMLTSDQSQRRHYHVLGYYSNMTITNPHDVMCSWTEPLAPTGLTGMITRDPQHLPFSHHYYFYLFLRNILQSGTKTELQYL